MTVSRLWLLALAALAFAVVGCDKGRTNPPDVTVRVVNVAPGFPSLQFRREQITGVNNAADLAFKSGTESVYDQDTYDFFVDARNLATGTPSQKLTFSKSVQAGTLYTFALVQTGTGLRELVLETPTPATGATDAQVIAAHAAEGSPAMDIFLERPGADITGAVPWGSVSYLGTLNVRNVATGDYQITITAAGNRANVLLTSTTFTLNAASSTAFVITPEGGEGVSPLSVTVASESTFGSLFDRNAQSAVRVINAAADKAPRDVAFNGQFSPPLFAAVPFAAPTAYAQIAPGDTIPVNVTPPGNPGALELDKTVSAFATRRHTLMFLGATGALTHTFATDDGRRIVDESTLRFYNAADQFASGLDLIILNAGVDATAAAGAPAFAFAAPGTIVAPLSVPPTTTSYTVYLRQTATTTIVAGPIPITVAAQGIYGILATNGADSVTATVTLTDDFP